MVRTSRYPFLARQSYSFSFFLTSSKQTLDAWCSLVVRNMYYATQYIGRTFSDIMDTPVDTWRIRYLEIAAINYPPKGIYVGTSLGREPL